MVRKRLKIEKIALHITGIYLIFGFAWILFSDRLAWHFAADLAQYNRIQNYKGFAFVILTGLVILIEVNRTMKKQNSMSRSLEEGNDRLSELNDALLSQIDELHAKENTINWQNQMIEKVFIEMNTPLVMWELKGDVIRANAHYYRVAKGTQGRADWFLGGLKPESAGDIPKEHRALSGEQTISWRNQVFSHQDGSPFVISIGMDITEDRYREMRIRDMIEYDRLTGAYNRNRFERDMEMRVHSSQRFHMLYLDIDDFMLVNNLFGYNTGDRVLIRLYNLLCGIYEGATVYRWSGDEFIIICTHNESSFLEQKTMEFYEQIKEAWVVGENSFRLRVCAGMVSYPDDGTKIDELLRNAELAIESAKSKGKSRYEIYRPYMLKCMESRAAMYRLLDQALSDGQLSLKYQPLYRLDSRELIAFEVLLRWEAPGRAVTTKRVIEIAEESDRIIDIDLWVIEQVYGSLELHDKPFVDQRFCINISSKTFQSERFLECIDALQLKRRIAPHRIQFEITEHTIMEDMEASVKVMDELKKRGYTLSMDDFGTKYSSLNYLAQLPFDYLKIDKSYVHAVPTDAKSRRVAQMIIQLAHDLGLRTVAEGVETEEQERYMQEMGCDAAQGYLFARPVDISGLLQMGKESEKWMQSND